MNKITCPRRSENHMHVADSPFVGAGPDQDWYRSTDQSCIYCGSLDPDVFMARLEKGDILLGATDKSYKVYVENDGGEDFKQTYRDDDHPYAGAENPIHNWITRPMHQHKFYFQHLSVDQMRKFVDLYNQKKVKFAPGDGFYVWPFFMGKKDSGHNPSNEAHNE